MYIGELSALGSALLWASSSIVFKTQAERIGATALNALRCAFAAAFFALIVLATGRLGGFAEVSFQGYLTLISSVVIGIGIGDTAYFRSMTLVGVSRALPISGSFPLITLVFSLLFLKEPLSFLAVLGSLMVVGGVYLVALPRGTMAEGSSYPTAGNRTGILLALLAAVSWASSASILSWGMGNIDLLLANTIRLPVAALFLGFLAMRQSPMQLKGKLGTSTLGLLAIAGILGTGFGSMLFLSGIQNAGAAVGTTLSSTAPLFAAPLARLFLKEPLTRVLVLGILLSFAGIVLIVIRTG